MALIWTATEFCINYAYFLGFSTGASMYSSNNNKYRQYSVRLVKDSA